MKLLIRVCCGGFRLSRESPSQAGWSLPARTDLVQPGGIGEAKGRVAQHRVGSVVTRDQDDRVRAERGSRVMQRGIQRVRIGLALRRQQRCEDLARAGRSL